MKDTNGKKFKEPLTHLITMVSEAGEQWKSLEVSPYLCHQASQDVQRLTPHMRQLAHGDSVHSVRILIFFVHLQ